MTIESRVTYLPSPVTNRDIEARQITPSCRRTYSRKTESTLPAVPLEPTFAGQ